VPYAYEGLERQPACSDDAYASRILGGEGPGVQQGPAVVRGMSEMSGSGAQCRRRGSSGEESLRERGGCQRPHKRACRCGGGAVGGGLAWGNGLQGMQGNGCNGSATSVTVFIHTRKSKSADAWAVPSRDWLYFFVYSAREPRPGDAARTVQSSLGRT